MYTKKLSAIGIVLASCCFFSNAGAQKVYRITAGNTTALSKVNQYNEVGTPNVEVVNVTAPILDKYCENAKNRLIQNLQTLRTSWQKEINEIKKKLAVLQANNYDPETISQALESINFVSAHADDAFVNIPTEYYELLNYCAKNHKLFVCMCGMVSIANEFIEQAKLASREIEKELKSHKSVIGKIKSKLKRGHKDQGDESIRKQISASFKRKLQAIKDSANEVISAISRKGDRLQDQTTKDIKPATVKTKDLVSQIIKNSKKILSKKLANTIADNRSNISNELHKQYGSEVNIEGISSEVIKDILLNVLDAQIANMHPSNKNKISDNLDNIIENSIANL